MSTIVQLSKLILLLLGAIGTVGCLSGVVGVWVVHARTLSITDDVFQKADESVTFVEQKLDRVNERVAAARITSEEVKDAISEWAKDKALEQIELPEELRLKAERLESSLAQVDGWLETAEASVELSTQVLAIVQAEGLSSEQTQSLDQIATEVTALRREFERIRQFVGRVADPDSSLVAELEEELAELKPWQILVRVVATLGDIESRIQVLDSRVGELHGELREIKQSVQSWVFVTALSCSFLLLWMAAGQAALCLVTFPTRKPPAALPKA